MTTSAATTGIAAPESQETSWPTSTASASSRSTSRWRSARTRTILDAAFRQGIHLMHGCKEGQCSACKSYLLDGDMQMERYSTFALQRLRERGGLRPAVPVTRVQRLHDRAAQLRRGRTARRRPIQDVRATVAAVQPVTHDIVSLRLEAVEPADVRRTSPASTPTSESPAATSTGRSRWRPPSPARRPDGVPDQEVPRRAVLRPARRRYRGRATSCRSPVRTAPSRSRTGTSCRSSASRGGAGMAPILSLLRQLSETGSPRPVRFYYGARTAADLFYLDEIAEIGQGPAAISHSWRACRSRWTESCPTR